MNLFDSHPGSPPPRRCYQSRLRPLAAGRCRRTSKLGQTAGAGRILRPQGRRDALKSNHGRAGIGAANDEKIDIKSGGHRMGALWEINDIIAIVGFQMRCEFAIAISEPRSKFKPAGDE